MKLTGILTTVRPALLLASCLLSVNAAQANAGGSNDPLEQPALMTSRAAHATLLSVVQAGTRLVAVGEHGVIVYSDDQGKSWTQAKVPVSVNLTAVQFIDPKNGWAVGHDGIALSTSDGGLSWSKRFDGNQANTLMLGDLQKVADEAHHALDAAPASAKQAAQAAADAADNAVGDVQAGAKFGPSRPLLGVYFKNVSDGYLVGSYGQILHTADGGKVWESFAGRLHNSDGLHYNAIAGTAGGTLVIAGEGGKVYRSRDNGATWQTLETGYKGQLYGVIGVAGEGGTEDLLAFGFGGHTLLSSGKESDKAGITWQELPAVTHKNLIGGVLCADGSIVLATQDGSLLKSSDHGHSFSVLLPSNGLEIAGVAQAAGANFALSGVSGVHFVSASGSGKVN
ncbi:MAG: hypothetical protein JO269_11955 [Burkholderiaceae bacterium]|nr:hypothetical protein [Burkholderiaceae bacterium]